MGVKKKTALYRETTLSIKEAPTTDPDFFILHHIYANLIANVSTPFPFSIQHPLVSISSKSLSK